MSDMRSLLGAEGPIAHALPDFRERPEQIELAEVIEQAIAQGRHGVGEAGTGLGKSLAYLVPAIRSGRRTAVATFTKHLQDQLAQKELPLLESAIGPFSWAVLKGASNYLCRRDYERAHEDDPDMPPAEELEPIDAALQADWNGDLEHVALTARARQAVAADSASCTEQACPFFDRCFWQQAKERAREAQIVVVNQALLGVHVASGGRVLPDFEVLVADEAQNLADAVRQQLAHKVTPRSLSRLLGGIRRQIERDRKSGREIASPGDTLHAVELAESALWSTVADALDRARDAGLTTIPLPAETRAPGMRLAEAARELGRSLPSPGGEPTSEAEAAWMKLGQRTARLEASLRLIFGLPDQQYVRTLSNDQRAVEVSALPISVAGTLASQLFPSHTVIAVSATLANGPNDFAHFRGAVGMPDPPQSMMFYRPWVFDFKRQAILYIAPDRVLVPQNNGRDPLQQMRRRQYLEALAARMLELVRLSEGRAFLLFTSRSTMDQALRLMLPALTRENFTTFIQGQDASRRELLERFKEAPRAVLFGVRSFWEGVDVRGEALSLVVIDRLPIPDPRDPLTAAIQRQIEARGGDPFLDHAIPQAALMFKQGLGRLIRSESDRGVMAILDARLYLERSRSGYAAILAALPPAPGYASLDAVRRFFAESEARAHAS